MAELMTVWKYSVAGGLAVSSIDIPAPFKPVAAMMQDGVPTVWFEVTPTGEQQQVELGVFGTGHAIDAAEGWEHVGSMLDGPYVWHLYWRLAEMWVSTDA